MSDPFRWLPPRVRRAFRLAIRRRDLTGSDVEAEIRFHLDARVDALVASGMPRHEAEAEAQRRFGPMSDARRELLTVAHRRDRTLTWLERLDAMRYELTHVMRRLRRSPGITITVMLTFALGIGVNAMMFDVVDRLLFRDPPHVRDLRGLAMISYRREGDPAERFGRSFSYTAFKAIRDAGTLGTVAAASLTVELPLGRGADATRASVMFVSASYFETLGVTPGLGRFFTSDEDLEPAGSPVAVISRELWQRQFGERPDILGKPIDLGRGSFTIVGVAPAAFRGLGLTPIDVWLPVTTSGAFAGAGPGVFAGPTAEWLRLIARVPAGVNVAPLAASLTNAYRATRTANTRGPARSIVIRSVPRNERAFGELEDVRVPALVWAGSVLVLLMACVNVANLLIAQSTRRGRETAVRLSLGVSRSRLIGQHLLEPMVLCAAGAVAAALVVNYGGGILRATMFAGVREADPTIDGRLVAYIACVAAAAGILAGALPAFRSTRTSLASALRTGQREGGGRGARIRTALTVAQATLSLLLLVGTGLFMLSLRNVSAIPMGMDTDRLLFARMNLRGAGYEPGQVDALFARMEQRLRTTPGIENASVAVTVPFWSTYGTSLALPGRDSAEIASLGSPYDNAVSPSYFATLGTRILRGRAFDANDRSTSARVAIVDETLARRYWPGRDPVGECVQIGGPSAPCTTVVGVVENVRQENITTEGRYFQLYVPLAQARESMTLRLMVVRPSEAVPARAAELVRRTMQETEPNLPYASVEPFAEIPDLAGELRPWRLAGAMFGAFGVLALVLAAIGLYGVVAQGVSQRFHEMGVRMALGATTSRIMLLVLGQGLRPVFVGAGIGWIVALAAGSFVQAFLFRVSPRDPVVLATVTATLGVAGVLACLLPALRAVRVDPATALRHD